MYECLTCIAIEAKHNSSNDVVAREAGKYG